MTVWDIKDRALRLCINFRVVIVVDIFSIEASPSTNRVVVIPLRSEGYLTPTILAPTRGSFRSDHMTAKKKPNTSTSTEANASTEARPSTDNTLITMTNGNNNNNLEDNGEDVI